MKYMATEMQDQLKSDIKNGKIWGLRLVKTWNDAIKNNSYAQIFNEAREITKFDGNCFYLKTRHSIPHYLKGSFDGKNYVLPDFSIPSDIYSDTEAYYSAFSYYNGQTLIAEEEVSSAVDQKTSVKINEYEVIRSY